MCEQLKVLKKIHKAGKVNGFSMELAEAQVKDYVTLKRDVDSVKESVAKLLTGQQVQEAKIDLVIQRLNSPVEQERLQGAYWRALATVMKSKTMWLILIILIFLIAMTGNEIKHLLGWLPTGV